MIQREEHDGTRRYYIEGEDIRMEGEKVGKSLPREDFATVADLILNAIKGSSTDEVTSPDGVEEFWMKPGSLILKHGRKIVLISQSPFGIPKLR